MIDFSGMANAMLVDSGGYLLFNNVMFSDIANASGYTYTLSQPYINRGVGYGLWPTIALAPKALVRVQGSALVVAAVLLGPRRP